MFNCLWSHRLQLTRLLCPNYLPEFAQTHVHRVCMPSDHFILCHPLLLLPLIFSNIRVSLLLLTTDGHYWLWWRAKVIAVMEVYCIYRKALSHAKSAKGSRWEKKLQKAGDLENILKYLHPTLVYPEFSKTLF